LRPKAVALAKQSAHRYGAAGGGSTRTQQAHETGVFTISQQNKAFVAAVHSKRINDTYGHDVGDQVLAAIGREVQTEDAIVGRMGGEEFAILIEGAGREAALAHAEAIRARIAALAFDAANEKAPVTCSFGVAERQADESIDQLLRRADTALYEAKSSGRDRVVEAGAALEDREGRWPRLVRSERRTASEDGGNPRSTASRS
jgi:diguanylate cyclase (GGDEF)-like protein